MRDRKQPERQEGNQRDRRAARETEGQPETGVEEEKTRMHMEEKTNEKTDGGKEAEHRQKKRHTDTDKHTYTRTHTQINK